MAATTSSDIAGALSLLQTRRLTSQINWSSVLYNLLPVVPATGVGKSANWTVEVSGQSNASAVAQTKTWALSDAAAETELAATLAWAIYENTAAVTGLAKAIAANTGYNKGSLLGDAATLFASRLDRSYKRCVRGVAAQLYSGQASQTPEQVVGIATAIDGSAGGSYAGIAVNSYAEWASTEATQTASSLTFATLRTNLLTPIYTASGTRPTFLITTPTRYDQLRDLYGTKSVPYITEMMLPGVSNPDIGLVRAPRKVLLAGMEAFMIDGIPVFRDADCTTDTIYAINTEHIWFWQLMPDGINLTDQDITDRVRPLLGSNVSMLGPAVFDEIRNAIRNPTGLIPQFTALGNAGTQEQAVCTVMGQLCVDRRNVHGKLVLT